MALAKWPLAICPHSLRTPNVGSDAVTALVELAAQVLQAPVRKAKERPHGAALGTPRAAPEAGLAVAERWKRSLFALATTPKTATETLTTPFLAAVAAWAAAVVLWTSYPPAQVPGQGLKKPRKALCRLCDAQVFFLAAFS